MFQKMKGKKWITQKYVGMADLDSPRRDLSNGGLRIVVALLLCQGIDFLCAYTLPRARGKCHMVFGNGLSKTLMVALPSQLEPSRSGRLLCRALTTDNLCSTSLGRLRDSIELMFSCYGLKFELTQKFSGAIKKLSYLVLIK